MSTQARHRDPATQRRVVLRDAELLRELALGLFTLSALSNTCASPSQPAEVVSAGNLAFVILTRSIHVTMHHWLYFFGIKCPLKVLLFCAMH